MAFVALEDELSAFYRRSGFGDVAGRRPRTVAVYTGCMLVPLPNIETRRRFLKYHDLHHLITGYSVGRIGEGEVSAWELGSGSAWVSPTLGLMNLIALSTGLFLEPRRMWRAFRRGCGSRDHRGGVAALQLDVDPRLVAGREIHRLAALGAAEARLHRGNALEGDREAGGAARACEGVTELGVVHGSHLEVSRF